MPQSRQESLKESWSREEHKVIGLECPDSPSKSSSEAGLSCAEQQSQLLEAREKCYKM